MLLDASSISPMISVLMPAYNAEKYILKAIDSILAQTYQNFELIIANDASTDGTKNIIDAITDHRVSRYHNLENLGKTTTVEILFRHARGDLITIHDADDISLPTRFEKQVAEFSINSELAMCGTSFISINEDESQILEMVQMKTSYTQILADIDQQSQFHGPTMMIRRDILEGLGEIYRSYFRNNNEDTDLAYRIAEKHLAYNLPEILYKYRIHSSSLCRSDISVRNRNMYKIVVFLAKERKVKGIDSVGSGHYGVADSFFNEITRRYGADTSLIHREAASYLMYYRLYLRAITESWLAFRKNPMHTANVRTLLYCMRKAVMAYFARMMA